MKLISLLFLDIPVAMAILFAISMAFLIFGVILFIVKVVKSFWKQF